MSAATYDVFVAHATFDQDWVRALGEELLAQHGLKPYLDEQQTLASEGFVFSPSNALWRSRFLLLALSAGRFEPPWVGQEWTRFTAMYAPTGRIIVVKLAPIDLPSGLGNTSPVDATDRDVGRAAAQIAQRIEQAPPSVDVGLPPRTFAEDLFFTLETADDERVTVVAPSGKARVTAAPWVTDRTFSIAHGKFERLVRQSLDSVELREELSSSAAKVGSALFELLFQDETLEILNAAGEGPTLVTLVSDDPRLHSLPWELLCREGQFLVREGQIDLVRAVPAAVPQAALPHVRSKPLKLVVNVSAPYQERAGLALDYEHESYRITRALDGRCPMMPTELGTLDDLLGTIARQQPAVLLFSGYSQAGQLVFEDNEGGPDPIGVPQFIERLSETTSKARGCRLPRLVYLACYPLVEPLGSPSADEAQRVPTEDVAAALHRAGISQVVGYFGPNGDELSTGAEAAFFAMIAGGHTTRYAARKARQGLTAGSHGERFPLAWSQLVCYQQRPEVPLTGLALARRRLNAPPRRETVGAGSRRRLSNGFIGRRSELHRIRRLIREGCRVMVFQGLGGLGKSTLAFHVLPMLAPEDGEIDPCVLWCQEAAREWNPIAGLIRQFSDDCRGRMGPDWESIVQDVDRRDGHDIAGRLLMLIEARLEYGAQLGTRPGLVLYLDNLESLLVGPAEVPGGVRPDAESFGRWQSDDLRRVWQGLVQLAVQRDNFRLLASCRYRNEDFLGDDPVALVPVSPMSQDALFRMTAWFDGLRRLLPECRAALASCLDGHPRAVEFADALIGDALRRYDAALGHWPPESEINPQVEWELIVQPALPKVQGKLWDDLLLAEIWERVLDAPARRMLYRMTLPRGAWEADLENHLGDLGDPPAGADPMITEGWGADPPPVAASLRRASLVQSVERVAYISRGGRTLFREQAVHPTTAEFVGAQMANAAGLEVLRRRGHLAIGRWFEERTKTSNYLETFIEGGWHLFQAAEYDRSFQLFVTAAIAFRKWGNARESLATLEPFLADQVQSVMKPELLGDLFGTQGLACADLGEVDKAIELHERALEFARRSGDRRGQGIHLGNLGVAYGRLGDARRAIEYYKLQLALVREIGDRRGEEHVLGNLGSAYYRLGQYQKAIEFCKQALMIDREVGDRDGEAADLSILGTNYADLGELQTAIEQFEEALAIDREIGNRRGEGFNLNALGAAYGRRGETEKAVAYHEQALRIAREIGNRDGEGNALGSLGLAYAQLGDLPKAVGYYEQALAIAREIGDRRGEANRLVNLASAYSRLGDRNKEIEMLRRALPIGRAIEDPEVVRICKNQLGHLNVLWLGAKDCFARLRDWLGPHSR